MGEVSTALYTRADTNDIVVVSPRTTVIGKVADDVALEATHTLDAWSGASIDVTTAATRPIHEVRNEVRAGGSYTNERVNVAASYRYSTEPDYWSHGAVGTVGLDLAQHNTQLALSAFGSHDTVGRAGDSEFKRPLRSLGARLTYTQVVDRLSLLQFAWETIQLDGYQASPYRFVAVGTPGTCNSLAATCRPEVVPDQRYRHSLVARGRRSITAWLSVGVEYRFYFDSWGVQSQTVSPDVRLSLGERGVIELDYRYYTQGEATFYRPRYFDDSSSDGYFTRDRKLSALYTNRIGLSYLYGRSFRDERIAFNVGVRTGLTRYRYLAFVGLAQVDALEATLLLGLALP